MRLLRTINWQSIVQKQQRLFKVIFKANAHGHGQVCAVEALRHLADGFGASWSVKRNCTSRGGRHSTNLAA